MANQPHGLSRYDYLLKECLDSHALNSIEDLPQIFGYLHKANPVTGDLSEEHIVGAYNELVETMRTAEIENGPADAGMTFFGQMVDHDITLDASSSIGTRIDPRNIRNIRTPALDLDCVYGDGPEASPHLYSRDHEGFMLFGREENPLDLARNSKGTALIGDPRNDENIIISQIQGAFISLHNILMSHMAGEGDTADAIHHCAQMGIRKDVWDHVVIPKLANFEQVRRFIRLHYQWIILHDLLPAFVDQKIIDETLENDPFDDKGPIMPAEFSGAAYRFGHATVQPKYKLTKGGEAVKLFKMLGFSKRTAASTLEFDQFFSFNEIAAQKALPVGIKMADVLFELPDNIVGGGIEWNGHTIDTAMAKKLGLRNILRDRTALALSSGQQMAKVLKLKPLDVPKALTDNHITKTPLWYYCLQEASEQGNGRLTGVGGSIVASVFIRLLKLDPESVLNTPGFTPWEGFGEHCTMGSMMQFVEVNRDEISHKEELYCG